MTSTIREYLCATAAYESARDAMRTSSRLLAVQDRFQQARTRLHTARQILCTGSSSPLFPTGSANARVSFAYMMAPSMLPASCHAFEEVVALALVEIQYSEADKARDEASYQASNHRESTQAEQYRQALQQAEEDLRTAREALLKMHNILSTWPPPADDQLACAFAQWMSASTEYNRLCELPLDQDVDDDQFDAAQEARTTALHQFLAVSE